MTSVRTPRAGRSPAVDLVHPRRKHLGRGLDRCVVDCAVYVDGHRVPGRVEVPQALARARDAGGFVWLGLHEPSDTSFAEVAAQFGLHDLAAEDAVHAHQRPKLESFDDLLFLVLKTVTYSGTVEVIETGEVMVFVGPDFVISVRHGEHSQLSTVRRDLEARPEQMAIGPAAVLHAVVDRVVDGYQPAADAVEEDVDELEEQVFSEDARQQPTARIYQLKREVLEFRRVVDPLLPATSALASAELPCVDGVARTYFRDVHDHVVRVQEQVAQLDALLDSALAANLAQVAVRQNQDMRKISAWVAIAGVDTLIAGVYGMNFETMPELEWTLGYPFALSLMAVSSTLLWRGFRRNRWL